MNLRRMNDNQWSINLPPDWDRKPLKGLGHFRKGLSILKTDLVEEGIPVVSYGQIHAKINMGTTLRLELIRYIPSDLTTSNPDSCLQNGDLVLADTSEDLAGVGNAVFNDTQMEIFAGYHTVIFRPMSADLYPKFLSYATVSNYWRDQVRARVQGVKVYSITQKILRTTEIPLPSLEEQKAIVKTLDAETAKIDRAIDLLQQELDTLEQLKKSIIHEAVTKGLDPTVPMKPSGVAWMPVVPLQWTVLPARYCVLTRENGNWGDTPLDPESGVYCLRAADFDYARLGLKTQEHFIRRTYTDSVFEQKKVRPGDILVEKSGGGERTPVGRAILIREPLDATFSNFLERISVHEDLCTPDFFTYWWTAGYQSSSFVPYFNQTTGIQNLNTARLLRSNVVALPSLSNQQRIVDYLDDFCESLDISLEKKLTQISILQRQRQSLIFEYVTGKRRVSEVS